MGTKHAPSYACLIYGFKEETHLYPTELPKHFPLDDCLLIESLFKGYMGDVFIFMATTSELSAIFTMFK